MNRKSVLSGIPYLVLACLMTALLWSGQAVSGKDKRAEVEALTHAVIGLSNAYQKASANKKSKALQNLIDAIVERQALLAELVETDTGFVLKAAIPASVRNQMPADVRDFIEHFRTLDGELAVFYEDFDDGTHRIRHTVLAEGKRVSLHFGSGRTRALSGTPVKTHGLYLPVAHREADAAMAVESANDVVTLAASGDGEGSIAGGGPEPVPGTFGEQRTAVILVNFPTHPAEPWTAAEAEDVVFSAVGAFVRENSQEQAWLSGEVFGWFTLPVDPEGCPTTEIALQAQQAAQATGADLSGYDRFIYAFPNIGCSWSGLGTFGGSPSRAWLDGTLNLAGIVSHELGHNFGLRHSHSQVCSGGTTLSNDCIAVEYGDVVDRMGSSSAGHFNAFQKERLGWLDYGGSPAIVTADTSGSYVLEAYAAPGSGAKAIRIPLDIDAATGQIRWYYLESRQPYGFDDFISTSRHGSSLMNGVVFRVGTWGDADSSYLLDMTPGSQYYDWDDLALAAGQSYSDPVAGVTVTVDAVDSGGATVYVDYGPQSCAHTGPSVELTPSDGDWAPPGTPVSYTVTVSNGDPDACGAATFALTSQVPAGWTAVFQNDRFVLEPGTSTATVMTVNSAASAADGVYAIAVNAILETDPAYAGSASASYTVMAGTGDNNSPPIAEDDSVTLEQVQPVVIAVLANDWDPDDDTIRVTQVTQGAKGSVVSNGDGTLTYTPGKGFKGNDSFTYAITDGTDSATAEVVVSVQETPGGGKGGGKGGNKGGAKPAG